jgi:DNA processing protein
VTIATPTTVPDNVLPIADDGDTDRLARIALSVCADAHGEVVVQANTYGVLPTLRALANGRAQLDGTEIPATALVGRLTKADLLETLQLAAIHGIRVITPADADWPAGLADLGPRQPLVLWARGNTGIFGCRDDLVALTGTRNATSYGTQVVTSLAVGLAQRGHVIVSSAGSGIDAAAHRAALVVPAPTVAVVPCGLDTAHPAENADLLLAVADLGGVVISECPPGSAPSRARALRAGQLIAALASGTVLVEAGVQSAALHTADEALRLGRAVGAVPGPLTSHVSEGCHRLFQQGETALVVDADNIAAMVRSRRG